MIDTSKLHFVRLTPRHQRKFILKEDHETQYVMFDSMEIKVMIYLCLHFFMCLAMKEKIRQDYCILIRYRFNKTLLDYCQGAISIIILHEHFVSFFSCCDARAYLLVSIMLENKQEKHMN